MTYSVNTEYLLNKDTSLYAGFSTILRPLRIGDYSYNTGVYKTKLKDEEGKILSFGVMRNFGDSTTVGVNYSYSNMTNAIATLPIWDSEKEEFSRTAVNASQKKKSFNITLDHQFNKHFSVGVAYSHLDDRWNAKKGYILDPEWGYNDLTDVNTAINKLRPTNHYSLNLSYENGKLYTGMLINWYTGNNLNAFSSKRFLILDWNLNYQVRSNVSVYAVINNLTNIAYETAFNARNGIGAFAMPSRNLLVGVKYTF